MVMTYSEQPSGAPQPDPRVTATADELARLVHLFRHVGKEDPADRFLFDLMRRYRGGEPR